MERVYSAASITRSLDQGFRFYFRTSCRVVERNNRDLARMSKYTAFSSIERRLERCSVAIACAVTCTCALFVNLVRQRIACNVVRRVMMTPELRRDLRCVASRRVESDAPNQTARFRTCFDGFVTSILAVIYERCDYAFLSFLFFYRPFADFCALTSYVHLLRQTSVKQTTNNRKL